MLLCLKQAKEQTGRPHPGSTSTIIFKITLSAAGEWGSFLQPLEAEGPHKRPGHSSAGNTRQWHHLLAGMTSSVAEENITDILLEALGDSELGEIPRLVFDLVQSSHFMGKRMEGWSRGLTAVMVERRGGTT